MTRGHLVFSTIMTLAIAALTIGCGEEAKKPKKAGDKKGHASATPDGAKGGATEGDTATAASDEEKEIQAAIAKLPEADRKLAEAQGVCPVSNEPLGSMGMPLKVTVKDRDVFLCCDGCKGKIEKDPDTYLTKLDEKKTKE